MGRITGDKFPYLMVVKTRREARRILNSIAMQAVSVEQALND